MKKYQKHLSQEQRARVYTRLDIYHNTMGPERAREKAPQFLYEALMESQSYVRAHAAPALQAALSDPERGPDLLREIADATESLSCYENEELNAARAAIVSNRSTWAGMGLMVAIGVGAKEDADTEAGDLFNDYLVEKAEKEVANV